MTTSLGNSKEDGGVSKVGQKHHFFKTLVFLFLSASAFKTLPSQNAMSVLLPKEVKGVPIKALALQIVAFRKCKCNLGLRFGPFLGPKECVLGKGNLHPNTAVICICVRKKGNHVLFQGPIPQNLLTTSYLSVFPEQSREAPRNLNLVNPLFVPQAKPQKTDPVNPG